jgi:ligand-binding sensor domain-containing protein
VGGGLSFFDTAPAQISEIRHLTNNNNSLVNNNVNAIIEDKQGKLWFATNNGISCWTPETNQWRHFFNNSRSQTAVFLSLCEDDLGRIWAGSYSNGVYLLDSKTGRVLGHYRHESGTPRVSDFVFTIHKDLEGNIWIGGSNGEIICCKIKDNQFVTYAKRCCWVVVMA